MGNRRIETKAQLKLFVVRGAGKEREGGKKRTLLLQLKNPTFTPKTSKNPPKGAFINGGNVGKRRGGEGRLLLEKKFSWDNS